MWKLRFELSAEGKKRIFDEFIPLLHDTKHEVLGELDNNSWYLVYIGTKTKARGQGHAKALVEDVKKQVSQSRELCECLTLQQRPSSVTIKKPTHAKLIGGYDRPHNLP